MRKFFTVGLIMSLFLISNSFAQVLLEDDFNNGAADSSDITTVNSNWIRHSGTQGPKYSATGLSYAGYINSGVGGAISFTNGSSGTNDGDVNRSYTDSIAVNDTVYVSFLVNLDSAKAIGDYFTHLGGKFMGTTFRLRVFAKDTAAGGWIIGLSKSSEAAVYSTTVLSYGQTYLVVGKYYFNPAEVSDDMVKLYVYSGAYPAKETATALVTLGPVGTGTINDPLSIGSVGVRQGTNTPTGKIDGIRLSLRWPFELVTIAEAIKDINSDFIPDRLNDTVTVRGVITSPNYQTSHNSYYMSDGTAGSDIFMYGPPKFNLALGDSFTVTGNIYQYNGMTEIMVIDSASWVFHSAGHTVPDPIVITIAQFNANPELYEGSLIGFRSLTKKSGTWPASGSANIILTDGIDTLVYRIDSDTEIDGSTEPVWPRDVIGIITQFDATAPYSGGYQFFPRYTTDILPAGTIPVELVSLTASELSAGVKLEWATATETNNKGFEVQKKSNGKYEAVGFVPGAGTTTERRSYSFIDKDVRNGKYAYRLKQIDFDGTVKFLREIEVEVNNSMPAQFALAQNFPNPFNPSTTISFTLAVDSKISLKLFNVLGQEVATLLNGSYVAGPHEFKFNASHLNSGIYFYKLTANGLDGSAFNTVRKMMLAK